MSMKRREFLMAGLALNLSPIALAQQGRATPSRSAKTTRLFKSPGMYPNALAVMTDGPGGLWIGQQKVTAQSAQTYQLPMDMIARMASVTREMMSPPRQSASRP